MISSVGHIDSFGYMECAEYSRNASARQASGEPECRDAPTDRFSTENHEAANFSVSYSRSEILENHFHANAGELESADAEQRGPEREKEQMIEELEARDAEVRRHEQTHAAILGPYLRGGPFYTYQTGPDGRSYAVGGHVIADTGKEATPEATANKARVLKMSSTSVCEPSPEDMSIASQAERMKMEALAEMTATG